MFLGVIRSFVMYWVALLDIPLRYIFGWLLLFSMVSSWCSFVFLFLLVLRSLMQGIVIFTILLSNDCNDWQKLYLQFKLFTVYPVP